MNRDVYYIDRKMPLPLLLAYHNAILQTNTRRSGKVLKTDHVRVLDVNHSAYDCQYDGAIIFKDDRAEQCFKDVCEDNGLDVHAELLWERTPYVSERVMLELKGDGRMAVWHHHTDDFVWLTGDQVCPRPLYIDNGVTQELSFTDVIFAGAHNQVRKAKRRYARLVRCVQTESQYNYNARTGMTPRDWEYIVSGMHRATIYLVTTEGLVLEVTGNRMKWVRPTGLPAEYLKYPQLAEAGWVRKRVEANLRAYSRVHHSPSPSPFVDSVTGVVLTSKVELDRD
jgi:hypothetical protein